jgi:hypothetical protein
MGQTREAYGQRRVKRQRNRTCYNNFCLVKQRERREREVMRMHVHMQVVAKSTWSTSASRAFALSARTFFSCCVRMPTQLRAFRSVCQRWILAACTDSVKSTHANAFLSNVRDPCASSAPSAPERHTHAGPPRSTCSCLPVSLTSANCCLNRWITIA